MKTEEMESKTERDIEEERDGRRQRGGGGTRSGGGGGAAGEIELVKMRMMTVLAECVWRREEGRS